MNINNRQQLLAIIAGAAAVLWLGQSLIVPPLMQSWKERAIRITELRKSVARGALLLEREQAIRQRWESMRTNTLPNPVSAAYSQVFKAFDRWSQDSQISITSIKPQEKPNADDYMTVEFRVDAFGSLATLTHFLYNVEKDPLALKVEAVEISSRDNEGQQLTLGLQVSGLLLNQPEP